PGPQARQLFEGGKTSLTPALGERGANGIVKDLRGDEIKGVGHPTTATPATPAAAPSRRSPSSPSPQASSTTSLPLCPDSGARSGRPCRRTPRLSARWECRPGREPVP